MNANFEKYIFIIGSLVLLGILLANLNTPFKIYIIGVFIFVFLLAFIYKRIHKKNKLIYKYSKLDEIFLYIAISFSLTLLGLLLSANTPLRIIIIGLFIFIFLLVFINRKVYKKKQTNNEYSKLDEDNSFTEKFKRYWIYAFEKQFIMPKWIRKFWGILMIITTVLSIILLIIRSLGLI